MFWIIGSWLAVIGASTAAVLYICIGVEMDKDDKDTRSERTRIDDRKG